MHLSGCPKTSTLSWKVYCISPYRGILARHYSRSARRRCPQTPFQSNATAGALELPPAVSGNDTDFTGGALPKKLRDSVAILEAPNPKAPEGKAKVYVLGLSHVSKRDCDLVSALMVGNMHVFSALRVMHGTCHNEHISVGPFQKSYPLSTAHTFAILIVRWRYGHDTALNSGMCSKHCVAVRCQHAGAV
jgi:hypothetical protein